MLKILIRKSTFTLTLIIENKTKQIGKKKVKAKQKKKKFVKIK